MEELLKRAESGEITAIEEVANSYYRGKNGFPEDDEKALFWYERALEIDPQNVVGLNGVGNIYYNGYGVPVDTDKGTMYYLRAANLGYSKSQYNIASHLEDKGDPTCVGWYEKAFENGEADAAFKLYCIYKDGALVDKDISKSIMWLQKGAEAGNSGCQLDLAYRYLSGEWLEKDSSLAVEWMTAAAANGSATAMGNLSLMYEKGDGVEQDYEKSDEWAIKAAENGDAAQARRHALYYADGDGFLPQSTEKALELLQIGANAGDAASDYFIAHYYIEGKIVDRNYEKAIPYLETAGRKGYKLALDMLLKVGVIVYGDSSLEKYFEVVKQGADDGYYECMVRTSLCLLDGKGVAKDEALAMKYLRSAADGNYKDALFQMGVLNLTGQAVEDPSPEKAYEYFEAVLQKGEYDSTTAAAHRNIAFMYKEGNGLPQDLEKAIAHLDDAADHGDVEALLDAGLAHDVDGWANPDYEKAVNYFRQLHEHGYSNGTACLGIMYENGRGVEQDLEQAAGLLSQAVEQGNALGMVHLALMLKDGRGIEKNVTRAVELFQQASDIGSATATILLGNAYFDGEGIEKDIKRAIGLWEKAASEGDERAQNLVRQVYMNDSMEQYIDPQHAIDFLEPYATAGDSDVMYHLAEYASKIGSYQVANDWYVKAADAGSADAQYYLGLSAYLVDELDDRTLRWLTTAAEKQHVGAMNCMADILMSGANCVAQDRERAFKYYEVAANQGNAYALYQAGRCYIYGYGTSVNATKGFSLLKQSVDYGCYDALDTLGDCYYNGDGVAKNIPEAIRCYTEGLEKGHSEWCKYGLGAIHADLQSGYFDQSLAEQYLVPLTENDVTKSSAATKLGVMYCKLKMFGSAVHWFEIASDAGSNAAQYNLGVIYYNGEYGESCNLDKAEYYFSLAARNGYPGAASDAEDCRRKKRQQTSQHQAQTSSSPQSTSQSSSGGCYIATAVYGSYDCPEVWTLRRFRDYTLAETWYGMLFIRLYYAISPTIVRWFGNSEWFSRIWKNRLDKMVSDLQHRGIDSTPYNDRTIF